MKRESSYGQGGCNYFTVPVMCKLFCFWVTVDFTIIAFGRFCLADLNRTHYTFYMLMCSGSHNQVNS